MGSEATVSDGRLSTIRPAVGFVAALGTKLGINFPDRFYPQPGYRSGPAKLLTQKPELALSPDPSNLRKQVRDNMLTGLFEPQAGQVAIITTNRLLESEDSFKINI
ncbi:MAG: hypothetical protein E5X72_25065 [Mesorhizobium sp.]|uniref:hypothetical protein n=1 Tax=Mesorhizobium sp. TaxID=1871066 RepID=UPI0011FF9E37|nr:hypothetical protein [Mesorhizobium sp.]TIP01500.1 MAG: hypothetical protein E5X72_25065 [Mesorhizobium sp.]TIP40877.1 MAG: hypothetical protein E5X77_27175 [Mesorhizobium sp.]